MSPSRTRKPVVHARPRSEIVIAVVVGVGIVVATALLIYLMRPGAAGQPGGGLFNRQPRISWLIFGAIALGAFGTWWVINGRRRPRRLSRVVGIVLVWVIVAIVAVAAAVFWPDGIIRHYPSFPKPQPVTPTSPQLTAPPTTAPTATTKAPPTTAKP